MSRGSTLPPLPPLAVVEQEVSKRVDLADEDAVLWLCAVAFVARAWRPAMEDWHDQIPDGEMMRISASTVRLVREHLSLDRVDWHTVAGAMVAPDRALPDGRTLGELAPDRHSLEDLTHGVLAAADLQRDVQRAAGSWRTVLLTIMLVYVPRWHGTPEWPEQVAAFCRAVDDPSNSHWWTPTLHASLPPRPADIASTDDLRRLLLAGPDLLSAEAAEWCVRHAKITYVSGA